MNPDEEIRSLDAELERWLTEHSKELATLRLPIECFRACTEEDWERHDWCVRPNVLHDILNGNSEARRVALLALLNQFNIENVEFDPALQRIEAVATLERTDG